MIRCKTCKVKKPVSEFHKHPLTKTGLFAYCKACSAYATWKLNLRLKYGLSLEQYDAMSVAQLGVCAICGEIDPHGKRLSVDHNHETGQVRALLCNQCNVGLGIFKDSSRRLTEIGRAS